MWLMWTLEEEDADWGSTGGGGGSRGNSDVDARSARDGALRAVSGVMVDDEEGAIVDEGSLDKDMAESFLCRVGICEYDAGDDEGDAGDEDEAAAVSLN